MLKDTERILNDKGRKVSLFSPTVLVRLVFFFLLLGEELR